MEPASIGGLLAVGAAALTKGVLDSVAKDLYATLKDQLRTRYPSVKIDQLEEKPESKARRASVEEDLTAAEADRDPQILTLVRAVAAELQRVAPSVAAEMGVNLQDIAAGRILHGGIKVSGVGTIQISAIVSASGNIVVGGVTTGVEPAEPWPQAGKPRN
jgi:hypothetical protein